MDEELLRRIALSLLPNIGDIRAKRLIAYCGSVEAVFKEKRSRLEKIPGIGTGYAKSVQWKTVAARAEQELVFIQKNKITPLFFLDADYPKRLTHCEDSPILLYSKGKTNLNTERVISIVGTRKPTDYGRQLCEQLIETLAPYGPLIVSGMAYGIDICAHRAALANQLDTVGVFGHGLDRTYPAVHQSIADKMEKQGALLSDFTSNTIPDRENFPSRNRIVAGMADATIVIESKKNGGSLITAEIANSYNRDVFAFPGKVNDESSQGCNNLIQYNKAAMIQSGADIVFNLGWNVATKAVPVQKKLFIDLNAEEEKLLHLLEEKKSLHLDDISLLANMSISKASANLLQLEFYGLVRTLPGKQYQIN